MCKRGRFERERERMDHAAISWSTLKARERRVGDVLDEVEIVIGPWVCRCPRP